MDQLLGLAGGGDEIEPAAGDVHGGVEAKDAVGEGIAVVMVVEEPGVEVGVTQSGLDCGDVHGTNFTAWRRVWLSVMATAGLGDPSPHTFGLKIFERGGLGLDRRYWLVRTGPKSP